MPVGERRSILYLGVDKLNDLYKRCTCGVLPKVYLRGKKSDVPAVTPHSDWEQRINQCSRGAGKSEGALYCTAAETSVEFDHRLGWRLNGQESGGICVISKWREGCRGTVFAPARTGQSRGLRLCRFYEGV